MIINFLTHTPTHTPTHTHPPTHTHTFSLTHTFFLSILSLLFCFFLSFCLFFFICVPCLFIWCNFLARELGRMHERLVRKVLFFFPQVKFFSQLLIQLKKPKKNFHLEIPIRTFVLEDDSMLPFLPLRMPGLLIRCIKYRMLCSSHLLS